MKQALIELSKYANPETSELLEKFLLSRVLAERRLTIPFEFVSYEDLTWLEMEGFEVTELSGLFEYEITW